MSIPVRRDTNFAARMVPRRRLRGEMAGGVSDAGWVRLAGVTERRVASRLVVGRALPSLEWRAGRLARLAMECSVSLC